ncbi:MAG: GTP pyrophosphokinase family protein [Clostridia bacterium]|nr:GTP pyrophosphokinase family protein [Clostridia bacterium]
MNNKKQVKTDLIKMENFLEYNKKIKEGEDTFKKLMFIYSMAIKELETKLEIFKSEFKFLYNYELIDYINTRIKNPKSIIKKMELKGYDLTYKEMIEHINDIAGIRVVCLLKKDIFSIRDLIQKVPGINILKQKDYITHPKKSGYSSYHLIVEVPVTLSQNIIYVKTEIQIRTVAMDFWANLEHKMKYKPEGDIDKKDSKEWINCAKMINKIDNKMMLLNR